MIVFYVEVFAWIRIFVSHSEHNFVIISLEQIIMGTRMKIDVLVSRITISSSKIPIDMQI